MRANKFFELNTEVRPLLQKDINLRDKYTGIQKRLKPNSREFSKLYDQLVILTANFQRIALLIIRGGPNFDQNYEKLIKGAHFLQGSIEIITRKLTNIQDIKAQNSSPIFSSLTSVKRNKAPKNITQNPNLSGPSQSKLNPTVVLNGKLAVPYGRKLSEEEKALGVYYKTSPGAKIYAPQAGKIVFAGTFKGLGKLLIIECSNEYHLLMAGMGRIDVKFGTLVTAGQQVATMDTKKHPDPTLYLELRRNGDTVDPSSWLVSRPK